jgi:DNA-binding MarR family transcriptional regulator
MEQFHMAKDKTITDLDADEFFVLWVLLAQVKDALSKARHRELDRFNINRERRAILWAIQNSGGKSTPVQIARLLLRELNSVSEMLKRMEKEGLVERGQRSGKSSLAVTLTRKGKEVFDQSRNNPVDRRVLSILPKKKRERLAGDLWAIRNQALHELGIPEWHMTFPSNPNGKADD